MRHQAQPLAAVPPQGAEGRQGRGSPLVAEDTALAVQGARLAGLLHLETGSDEVNECGCRVANRAARARRGKHAATRSGEDAHHFAVCDVLLATGEASRTTSLPRIFFFRGSSKNRNYRVWGRRTVPDGKCRQTWSSRSHSQSSSWSAATLEPRPHSLHRSLPKPTPRRAHRSSCMHTQQFVHAEETLTCHRC